MKKIIIALAGVALLTGVVACVPKSPEKRAEWVTSKISRELDLNAEQKLKLNAVKDSFLVLQKEGASERTRNFETVKQMILSDRLDAAQAKALIAERQKRMDENFDTIFVKVADFHASLSAEQKREAAGDLEKLMKRWN